jgi:hypothetical protein
MSTRARVVEIVVAVLGALGLLVLLAAPWLPWPHVVPVMCGEWCHAPAWYFDLMRGFVGALAVVIILAPFAMRSRGRRRARRKA